MRRSCLESMVELRVLGPVEVVCSDRLLEVVPPQRRHVLAALAVDAGRPVTTETLIDRVWDEAPDGARRTLHTHITRIRRLLEQPGTPHHSQVCLVRRSGGYLLDINPERVDLHRFRRLVDRARDAAASDRKRAELLACALKLWHGEPLTGLPGQWAARSRHVWIQHRLDAVVAWAHAEIGNGNVARVIGTLTELAAEHPLAEPLTAALMRALHAAGRQADALQLYDRLRRELAEQLGADPSREAQDAHRAVLQGESATLSDAPQGLDAAPRPLGDTGVTAPAMAMARQAPAQLPADVPVFTGRDTELAELDRLLPDGGGAGPSTNAGDGRRETTAVISAVSGTAGVGKTALAIRWAHRTRGRFPDGQLYVNLRGYDPDQPVTVADALVGFLSALGVPGPDIPLEVEDRAARYRTEIADRRMLILLDNAATVEQVRPLLPGTGSCAVLVTSRDSLAGLVAVHGAHRLDLDLLPAADAHALLRRLIGPRVDAELDAAVILAERCARLPLALRVAAELAAIRPRTPLAGLVTELADQERRLDLLDAGGDPRAAVAAVFSWSLRHLPPDAARTFALLGLHLGPDLDAYAAAALAGTSLQTAHRALDRLTRAHLIHPTTPGRYGMHDLLRAYATRLANTTHSTNNRRAALTRLFDYYLATTAIAMDRLHPAEAHRRPRIPPAATPTPDLPDPDTARGWLDNERPCLTTLAAQTATNHAWTTHIIRLSPLLYRYLDGGHPIDALAIHGHARDTARHVGDRAGEAQGLLGLGAAHMQIGRHGEAVQHFQQALTLFRQTGDQVGEAHILNDLGLIEERLGRFEPAGTYVEQALALFRQTGDQVGEAHALHSLGEIEGRLGRHGSAADRLRQALTLYLQNGDRFGEAITLLKLGIAEAQVEPREPAAEHLRQALAMFRRLGYRSGEAPALAHLGVIHTRLGRPELAIEHHLQALGLFREIGDPYGEAWTLNGLGEASHTAGHHTNALTHHTHALTIAENTGKRDEQARAHTGLGHAHQALNNPTRAREHHDHALTLYTDLGMPEATR
ncbi:AfsR/SARP family transcriptional regulator [Plantactinospora sp. KLBMP9567]|uniref:AfsR/SARP family transcriptional regulator n=1 Tax=Plantactinospora sp. KLBMP9567 TaxID=3085900 RepID=UPI0029814FD6|nr:tetratricopeptide repeat protein [Plantactinospora sp. KLBMP9567]MDW5325050.1 tetratricopeptide repeat protein [Plantactinospora sp. KLBMP9567]